MTLSKCFKPGLAISCSDFDVPRSHFSGHYDSQLICIGNAISKKMEIYEKFKAIALCSFYHLSENKFYLSLYCSFRVTKERFLFLSSIDILVGSHQVGLIKTEY